MQHVFTPDPFPFPNAAACGAVAVALQDVDDCTGKAKAKGFSLNQLNSGVVLLVALLVSAAVFGLGAHFGTKYAYVVAQLNIDSQLSKLHTAATRRLAANADRQAADSLQQDIADSDAEYLDTTENTLSFQVCNGFANQRVAILSGREVHLDASCLRGCICHLQPAALPPCCPSALPSSSPLARARAGVIIAAELNRTVVLPRLLLNGTQPTEAEVNENTSGSVPFG